MRNLMRRNSRQLVLTYATGNCNFSTSLQNSLISMHSVNKDKIDSNIIKILNNEIRKSETIASKQSKKSIDKVYSKSISLKIF
jgi:hypothetical protein